MPEPDQNHGGIPLEMIEAARAGNPDAWRRLVEQYSNLVLTIPRELGLSDADIDEVFQSTWASLCRHLPLIRRPAALPAWIITTAKRETWRLKRRQQRMEGVEDVDEVSLEDDTSDPLGTTLSLERRQLLEEALAESSPRCQDLLKRVFFHSGPDSYEDIARDLEIPVGSVGPTRMRCLADLARILERRGIR